MRTMFRQQGRASRVGQWEFRVRNRRPASNTLLGRFRARRYHVVGRVRPHQIKPRRNHSMERNAPRGSACSLSIGHSPPTFYYAFKSWDVSRKEATMVQQMKR